MSMAAASIAPRETSVEDGGYVKGVGIAIVTQNKDPDGLGRVKLRFPWFDQPRESVWARVACPMAGNDRGFAMIPEVDDEVLVAFERGDLRFPVVIGCLHGGKDKIPFANKDGKNDVRMYKSRAGSVLVFNDGNKVSIELGMKDGPKIFISGDEVTVDNNKGSLVKMTNSSGDVEVTAKGKLKLSGTTVELSATGTLDIKAGPKMSLNARSILIN